MKTIINDVSSILAHILADEKILLFRDDRDREAINRICAMEDAKERIVNAGIHNSIVIHDRIFGEDLRHAVSNCVLGFIAHTAPRGYGAVEVMDFTDENLEYDNDGLMFLKDKNSEIYIKVMLGIRLCFFNKGMLNHELLLNSGIVAQRDGMYLADSVIYGSVCRLLSGEVEHQIKTSSVSTDMATLGR